ncbi:MAG: hypothetical protein AB9903_30130 [Vulcanimicrobiota bacterium]
MDTKLCLITQRSARDPKAKFDALLHHINEGFLAESFQCLDGTKAVGVDGVRKEDYTRNLDSKLPEYCDEDSCAGEKLGEYPKERI